MAEVRDYFENGNKKKGLPQEYIDFQIMSQVYHCTPSEFDEQEDWIIDAHIEFLDVQNEQARLERNRQEQRAKQKKR